MVRYVRAAWGGGHRDHPFSTAEEHVDALVAREKLPAGSATRTSSPRPERKFDAISMMGVIEDLSTTGR